MVKRKPTQRQAANLARGREILFQKQLRQRGINPNPRPQVIREVIRQQPSVNYNTTHQHNLKIQLALFDRLLENKLFTLEVNKNKENLNLRELLNHINSRLNVHWNHISINKNKIEEIIAYLNSREKEDKERFEKIEKKIYNKISGEFTNFYKQKIYGTSFKNKDYFLQNEKKIEEDTKFLKLLNNFRSSSAAHGFSKDKYADILKKLGVKDSGEDYSVVYETLISKVAYDVEHIYFNLISPDPPILDYYKKYLKATLGELKNANTKYQSIFERLASYLDDFPELYVGMIQELKKIYSKRKKDQSFVLEFGCFIEMISYSIQDKSQELVNYVIDGYEHHKPLTLAHFSHIIKNSEKVSSPFYDKVWPLVKEALKEEDTDAGFCAQHVIFCLIEKKYAGLDKSEVMEALKNRKIHYDLIKEYIKPKN